MEATAPEDPLEPPPPSQLRSRLNCRVRIDWECKWQLKCNLHSQQEQGEGEAGGIRRQDRRTGGQDRTGQEWVGLSTEKG